MGINVGKLIGGLAALLLGVWMYRRGKRPRHSGDTPHCRNCNYILFGIVLDRCPECGTLIGFDDIVFGEKRPSRWLAIAGAILALASLYPIKTATVAIIAPIKWIEHLPFWWLLGDLDKPQSPSNAWNEIDRRMSLHALSKKQWVALSDEALQIQSQPRYIAGPLGFRILQFLSDRFVENELSAKQKDQFFNNLLQPSLETRAVIGSEDPVPYRIQDLGVTPAGWRTRLRSLEWRFDDGPIHFSDDGFHRDESFKGELKSLIPLRQSVGKHRLRVTVELATGFQTSRASTDSGPFERVVSRELIADFEVVPGQGHIATTIPSGKTSTPRHMIQLAMTNESNSALVIGGWAFPFPLDTAFDVILRIHGKELLVGRLVLSKTFNGSFHVPVNDYPTPLPAQVDVVLRSSEDAARTTIDFTQIWKGEIVYKDVPVYVPATQPTQLKSTPP